jgi:hypothetical protein
MEERKLNKAANFTSTIIRKRMQTSHSVNISKTDIFQKGVVVICEITTVCGRSSEQAIKLRTKKSLPVILKSDQALYNISRKSIYRTISMKEILLSKQIR